MSNSSEETFEDKFWNSSEPQPHPTNLTTTAIAPIPAKFLELSELSLICVLIYSLLFCISAVGNCRVLLNLLGRSRSRINLLLLNLCIADLFVTFTTMPLEIFWRIMIQWYGGNYLCKLCQCLRVFGLYLSSMVVICISLDRYFAIIYPLKLAKAKERVKLTLGVAWAMAFLCAAPQAVVFGVIPHPDYPTFRQCVTTTFINTDAEGLLRESIYNVFSVSILYFIPLLLILFIYLRILVKIFNKSKEEVAVVAVGYAADAAGEEHEEGLEGGRRAGGVTLRIHYKKRATSVLTIADSQSGSEDNGGTSTATRKKAGRSAVDVAATVAATSSATPTNKALGSSFEEGKRKLKLRTSLGGGVLMARAKVKTLRLTCVIIVTFVFCWTPYVLITLWYMFDRSGAKEVDPWLQEGLFIMAVSNSVLNPFIYGSCGDCHRAGSLRRTKRRRMGGGREYKPAIAAPTTATSTNQRRSLTNVTAISSGGTRSPMFV